LLLDYRQGVVVVGAADTDQQKVGQRLHQVAETSHLSAVVVSGTLDDVLAGEPDVVILATSSFLRDVLDDVVRCARAGVNVVSPCEELAFPFVRSPGAAARIDRAAQEGAATVVGTGLNPGFIFDGLLAYATALCWDITRIQGRRVVDVSKFGEPTHRQLGIGFTAEEFEIGHREHTIAGHVGFLESIDLLCERLGLTLDQPTAQTFEPMIAETEVRSNYGPVSAGRTEGLIQRATASANGGTSIVLELLLHLRPAAAGFDPTDTFVIEGVQTVNLTLNPGMDAVFATSAQLVNSVPIVILAEPGLKTVKDLRPGAAWLNRQAAFR
jgi:4-hydroxy-tetrahydrodipicolinate reductase